MSKTVQSNPVSVLRDETRGGWPDGCTRYINCNFTVLKDSEWVTITDGGSVCGGITPQGSVFPTSAAPEGVTTYQAVKINTDQYGILWITVASYTALKNACNACCTS